MRVASAGLVYWVAGFFLLRTKARILGLTPGGSDVKNLPAMQETWVQSLGWEDALEKVMATHPSILAGRIPWTEEAW